MADEWVDPETGGGSPTGAGTEADPWNGLTNISWGAFGGGGNTITLNNGTYNEARIQLTSDGAAGSQNVIEGSLSTYDTVSRTENTAFFVSGGDYWTLRNLKFTNIVDAQTGGTAYAVRADNGAGLGFQLINCDLDIVGGGGSATVLRGVLARVTASDNDYFTVKRCRFTGFDYAINLQIDEAVTTGEFNHILIEDNAFDSNVGASGQWPIGIAYDASSEATQITAGRLHRNTKIIGNAIRGTTDSAAIHIRGSINSLIARNLVTDSGNAGSTTVNAINPGADDGLIMEDNTVITVLGTTADGDGSAIIVDWDGSTNVSNNCIVRRNWTQDCKKAATTSAINVWKGSNTQVISNIAFDASSGMKLSNTDSTGCTFYNNTVSETTYAGLFLNISAPASTVKNCILHTTGAAAILCDGGTTVPTVDHNCYFGYSSNPIELATVSQSVGANDLSATDPKFKDQANGDLRLDGDSPCIATGTKWWTGSENGQDGLRFYATPSMGAYEYRPRKSGYARKAGALIANTLDAGVDIAKAKAA